MSCIFCKIASKGSASFMVHDGDKVMVFLDINPITRGHTLVAPREHYSRLGQLPADLLLALFKTVVEVGDRMRVGLGVTGMNIMVNEGEEAGQIIPHLHIHVLPRRSGDGLRFGSRVALDEGVMEEIRARIAW